MKKIAALVLALILAVSVTAAFAEDKPYAGQTLTISTFAFNAELLQKNIYEPFMALTGCTIVADGANNAVRVSKIAEAAEGEYDVVIIGDMFVKQLMAEGKIDTIDASKLTNLGSIYENARAPMGEGYGPAYTFNRLGIVYNPAECPVEIKSFADLWNPELADYIAIPAITNTSGPLFYYGVAAAFGLTPGADDDAIFAKLAELKPNVKSNYTSANNTITMLNQGEICAAVLLDYSYTTAKSANPDYVWVNPAEGLYGGYNMLNVVTGSKNKELAELFIDFYLSYDVQYAEAMDGVDSPVRTDIELDAEHAANFTYGEMVNQLILPDWDFVTENLPAWTERWNETFGVK
ncbi:MAG: extracellular solute-binding protein [Clostridia bacterium]|nr:extracellular solute-binding protein [Clostridia bacterium]